MMPPRPLRKADALPATRRLAARIKPLPRPLAQPHVAPRELWLAAHLPNLPLEALAWPITGESSRPRAVFELHDRAQLIVAADQAARSAGARPGLSATAAMVLVPELQTRARNLHREQMLLRRLAQLAQCFTPRVCLEPPDGLLLEVKGSLHLFGGTVPLQQQFLSSCQSAGVRPRLSIAPTPLAALAGARLGESFQVLSEAQLRGALTPLPLALLRWPDSVLDRLARVGVRTMGQALRLPRAGFARRFGAEQLASLDHLTGRSADLRPSFRAPERFRARQSFTYELEQHDAILAALEPLLKNLGRFLQLRQCGVSELHCWLRHRHAPDTLCVLKLASTEADPQRLSELLGERLAVLNLPEPVRACELRSGRLLPHACVTPGLWQPGEHGGGVSVEAPAFIERLRARLGVEAVYGLELKPGHRPEDVSHSSALAVAKTQPIPWPAFRRPVWLLSMPEPLAQSDGLPVWHGALKLCGEPERLETAWWEGAEVARDYYCAIDERGTRLWVFRERTVPHRWFLHGVFG
jgi:protein ImuB